MKKIIASFAGGVITALVGNRIIKTDKARTIAVNSLATGMKIKDDVVASYETIKEDALDIVNEAKNKKDGE